MECPRFSPAENVVLDFNMLFNHLLLLIKLITEGFTIFSQVYVLMCTLDRDSAAEWFLFQVTTVQIFTNINEFKREKMLSSLVVYSVWQSLTSFSTFSNRTKNHSRYKGHPKQLNMLLKMHSNI